MKLEVRTVLLVDDEEDILTIFSFYLRQAGHIVKKACSVDEAIEQLAGPVDLVISDVRMPGKTGLDLVDWMRANRPQIPVIFLSGFADVERHTLDSLGVKAILRKPVKQKDFLDCVGLYLKASLTQRPVEIPASGAGINH